MSRDNLEAMLNRADRLDIDDGCSAYLKYHNLLRDIAREYGEDFERTVAAFAALSPNNDYVGNLRSLVSVIQHGRAATVSTYKACASRAYAFLRGEADFLSTTKGLKTLAFYRNIYDPTYWGPVTVDGHMVGAYLGEALTMKEAQKWLTRRRYWEVESAICDLAQARRMIPHQVQAVIWFTRKRVLGVKYDPQLGLFAARGEGQPISFDVKSIEPYPLKLKAVA